MRQAANIFRPPVPSKKAPTKNLEGYAAYERPLKEQYIQTLLTNTFGNTFYETKQNLIDQSAALHEKMLAEDPEFMSRAIGYARNKGFVRTQPIYGLARLAEAENGALFEAAFPAVIKTPNDLMDFAAIVHALRGNQGGRRIKRVAGSWLLSNISEYWAIKYGAEKTGGYSLKDLFSVYHPKSKGEPNRIVDYLFGRPDLTNLAQLQAYENYKSAKTDNERIELINAGRLPHEVTTNTAKGKTVWEAIALNMPMMALLKNLATIERHDAMTPRVVERITKLFSSQETVAGSKIFPYRWMEALNHVKNPRVQDALRIALELSFAGSAQLAGSCEIALDISGSMGQYLQAASVFAISAVRRAPDSNFSIFNTGIADFPVSRVDSVMTQAAKLHTNGGTDTSVVMKSLLKERRRVDNIVLITDEQQNTGSPYMDLVQKYRDTINRDVKMFVLNVAPYTSGALLDSRNPKNFYVYGLTEAALNYIAMATTGWQKFTESV